MRTHGDTRSDHESTAHVAQVAHKAASDAEFDVASGWIDRAVRDCTGQVIGVVVDVYDDPHLHAPAWLAVSTAFFGARIVVAPIAGTTLLGEDVVVTHHRADIHAAPPVTVHVSVSEADAHRLIDHFSDCERSRQTTTHPTEGTPS